jgi:hypothetical protein
MTSADDPKYTVQPQRERLEQRALDGHRPAESPRADARGGTL